jgi:hypothetical protein
MLRSTVVAVLLAATALAAVPARAQNVAWSVTVGSGGSLGAYVGIPGPVIAPAPVFRPVAVYPSAPIYRPTVVVATPGYYPPARVYPVPVYAAPRVVYLGAPGWVGPRPYTYRGAPPVYRVRAQWREHGHRH